MSTYEWAMKMDREDPLKAYRDHFHLIDGTIYMDGNSLGLMPKEAEASLMKALADYKRLGIDLWSATEPPYFLYQDTLAGLMAPLVGAHADEVTIHSNTTVNIHSMLATFFHPTGDRSKILVDDLNFPTGRYAIESFLHSRGLDPEDHLIEIKSRDGQLLDEGDLIEGFSEQVLLAFLPSVLYRSGQLLDIGRLTRAAHAKGMIIGFDCSHSAGSVPHHFSEQDVDFAVWCTYKYLNGGPGASAGLYLNRRHHERPVGLAGWQGYKKDKQFDLLNAFDPVKGAGGWQTGTQHIFSMAPLEGSLGLFKEVGMEALREKSWALTDFMMELIDALLVSHGFSIGTPRERERRGGHVALVHDEAVRINTALKAEGVLPDYRAPNVIRLAPTALYTRFEDVYLVIRKIEDIMKTGRYKAYSGERGTVA